MKPIFLFLLFSLCIFNSASAQNPLVKMWDKRFGGNDWEQPFSLKQISDAGYILGGYSRSSISGDKSDSLIGGMGDADYWIISVDSLGNKNWDKSFGGDTLDFMSSIYQTSDGGYILGGYSLSNISGNKTQNSWGYEDYWIIKTDSLGTKKWDKDLGGAYGDFLYFVLETTDKGFILGGSSVSNISGDKTQNIQGGSDFWIVKIDSLGNKQWDKDFGGSNFDRIISALQTADGGFILGGYSSSNIGGDKTQNSWGGIDYWIVKTDSVGNKQWDKDFGGYSDDILSAILLTSDGGFILGGFSNSGIGGDKSQSTWGSYDYWILKIDSLGNKQWDKDYGGSNMEELYSIIQTNDSGYLLAGDSYSTLSGDKTENNLGPEQTWILKTDSLGNKSWEKTILTPGHDEAGIAIQGNDGCYLISNFAYYGSLAGGYRSQATFGGLPDYWIVKFCDSTFIQANLTSNKIFCPGTCIDFLNLSFNAINYQWSFPGATPNSSTAINPTNICYPNTGSYSVTLIASNANGSDTLTLQNYITVFPQPPAQSITQSGDTLFAIAGSSSYQWYFNGNLISGATDYFYVATTSGDYNVVATDGNGCEVEAVINNVAASIQYTVDSKQIAAFPNPVITTLDIRGLKKNTADEIKIFNVFGEIVFSAVNCQLSFGGQIANCQLLPSGLYYIEITSDKKIYRTKFIKQ